MYKPLPPSLGCGMSGGLYGLIGFVTGCCCIYSGFYRSKLRKQYLLPESPCNDFLVHCCCESCALGQEYRELQHRGFDMSLGNLFQIFFVYTYIFINNNLKKFSRVWKKSCIAK